MPSDCCYFVDKASAAGAAPALNYFGSILHCPAVFTQNLGQTPSSDQVIVSWNANLTDGAKVRGTNETASPQEPASEAAASAADDSPASQTGTSTSDSSAVVPSQSAEASSEG